MESKIKQESTTINFSWKNVIFSTIHLLCKRFCELKFTCFQNNVFTENCFYCSFSHTLYTL